MNQLTFGIVLTDLSVAFGSTPLLLMDIIYILQFINSLNALSVVVVAYRSNTMRNLPWRIFILKGCLKLAEVVFLDLNEWPSLKIVNFGRDDFVMFASAILYRFCIDDLRYQEKMKHILWKHEARMAKEAPDNRPSSKEPIEDKQTEPSPIK